MHHFVLSPKSVLLWLYAKRRVFPNIRRIIYFTQDNQENEKIRKMDFAVSFQANSSLMKNWNRKFGCNALFSFLSPLPVWKFLPNDWLNFSLVHKKNARYFLQDPPKLNAKSCLKLFLFFHFNRLWNFHPFIIYAFTLKWAEEKTVIFKLFITLQQFLVEE